MLSIIIPTYNESKNIAELLLRIKKSLSQDYELIIVDDASPDGTGQIAEDLAKIYPLKVIHRIKKLGLASAVLDGFKAARGELLCVMDSDLSHPPEIIAHLLNQIKEQNQDIVIGSRFTKGGEILNWPKKRLFATNLAIFTVRGLTSVHDPMSGFFILRREVIQNIKLIPRGYKILLEILVKGKYKKLLEYPFSFIDRAKGESKIDTKVYLEFIAQLWDLYLYKLMLCFKIQS